MKSRVFILGCERSGSTWLSNIFSRHSEVEFYMEPLFRLSGVFDDVPERDARDGLDCPGGQHDRNAYVSEANDSLPVRLRHGWDRMFAAKYALSYRPGRPHWLIALDRAIAHPLKAASRRLGIVGSRRVNSYYALHLNTRDTPVRELPRKRVPAAVEVTKELRLNFKAAPLARAFPEARYLVLMRHPGAQIASVMRLFERGQLGELKACLPTLIDCAVASRRFDALADPECVALAQESIESRLALWWALNYDALIGDLRASGVDYRVVLHEELSAGPEETVAELFSFCGMEMEPQVDAYLAASTSQAPPSDSAVDTFRVSETFARTTIAKLDEALCCTIDAVLARVAKAQHLESGIGPHLERYLDGEGKLLREWP